MNGPCELFHSVIYEILVKSQKSRVVTGLNERGSALCPSDLFVLSLMGQALIFLSAVDFLEFVPTVTVDHTGKDNKTWKTSKTQKRRSPTRQQVHLSA